MREDNCKIGLCIAYKENHNNYGTSLLGYATLKIIENLGYDYEIIYYRKQRNIYELLRTLPLILITGGISVIKNRMKAKYNLKKFPDYAKGIQERTAAVNGFKEKYITKHLRTYAGFNNLCAGSLNYNLIIVGSDQVWLPVGLYTKFFNLLFVDEGIPKMSYSSSFGVSGIPFWQKKATRKYLDRFNAIGVREIRGKEIVESLTKQTATVVLDPTLLIDKDEWESLTKDCELVLKEEYIFCYFLGSNQDARKAATELKSETGLKIVFFRHMDEYIEADEQFGDYTPYNTDPADFVNYIKNARYVCTDSFHGTVFSIHFQRNFITFYRFDSNSKNSRNSRIDSLFSLLGLEQRLFKEDIISEILEPVDYDRVNEKLSVLKDESMHFLESNIRTCLNKG